MLRITDVDYLGDYKCKFIQYGLTRETIEWANGADFAPEFLYDIGTAQ